MCRETRDERRGRVYEQRVYVEGVYVERVCVESVCRETREERECIYREERGERQGGRANRIMVLCVDRIITKHKS